MPAKKAKKKTAKKKVSKKKKKKVAKKATKKKATKKKKKTTKTTVKKISPAQAGKAVKSEVKKLVKEIEALTKEKKPKKTKKKVPRCPTLGKEEFDNFYALSFVVPHLNKMRLGEVKKVIGELETFAKRLILVTHHACCGELEHAEDGGGYYNNNNYPTLILKYGGAEAFYQKLQQLEIPLEECAALFYALGWSVDFGGEAWAWIAEAAAKLEKMLPVFESNTKEIMTQIDHLIDLEHNNALFLEDFCNFSIYAFLDDKSSKEYECNEVSPTIKKLVEKYHGPLVPEEA